MLAIVFSGPNLDEDDDSGGAGHGSHTNGGSNGSMKPKSAQQKTGEKLLKYILNNDFVEGASYSFR
jgi:hypothetical protein